MDQITLYTPTIVVCQIVFDLGALVWLKTWKISSSLWQAFVSKNWLWPISWPTDWPPDRPTARRHFHNTKKLYIKNMYILLLDQIRNILKQQCTIILLWLAWCHGIMMTWDNDRCDIFLIVLFFSIYACKTK